MNIKELIEKYEEVIYHGYVGGVTLSNYKTFLDELKQLENSQKPTIPRFVADWIEHCKEEGRSLYGAMYQEEKVNHWLEITNNNMELFARAWFEGYNIEEEVEGNIAYERVLAVIPQVIADWIVDCRKEGRSLFRALHYNEEVDCWLEGDDRNMDLFIKAWLDGYKIEKEERYLVKIVGMDNINGYLSYNKELGKWFFGIASESRPYRARHTQKELENAGFSWVFNCEGVEITKVEE